MRRVAILVIAILNALPAMASEHAYLVGVGKADVTGPAVGVQMWGFVREGQVTEGIHTRLYSRAFVIADPDGGRLAFVSADIGSFTNSMHLDIVDALQARLGDMYTLENVILSATHTHAGPGGYWHYGATTPLGSPFLKEHYDAVLSGIVESVAQAHDTLAPGRILVNRGEVLEAGANRSMPAYLNNPAEERARYDAPTDRDMTLLRFETENGAIGTLNWFAVHPTAMTYDNKLISGDHKGRASQLHEEARGGDFVAAYAQANCGDVTPNLNLNNTGPGENEFETTHIIADRQYQVARELFDTAGVALSGGVEVRHAYLSFKYEEVDAKWTGVGVRMTCPSAYGYSFAAGSTEDGGGHPMFKEGMTTSNQMIDNLVKEQMGTDPPSDDCRACHEEKAILFATGEMEPEAYTQIVPITLARVGELVMLCVPGEFTTMAGRRLRDTVAEVLGPDNYYVIAGYTNDYTGYTTTREEYATQQYEGGHTLYGPWTLARYQQAFDGLARAIHSGGAAESGPEPRDVRPDVTPTLLATGPDIEPEAEFGDLALAPKKSYKTGRVVEIAFWSGNPNNAFATGNTYVEVQRLDGGNVETIATDNDWSTKGRWVSDTAEDGSAQPMRYEVTWAIPEGTPKGEYRIVHHGIGTGQDGVTSSFSAESPAFKVK